MYNFVATSYQNSFAMKKYFFISALLLMTLITVNANAQIYDSICHHHVGLYEQDPGIYDLDMRNMMELRDGGIVANVQVFGIHDEIMEHGNQLYKLVYDKGKLSFSDSTFVEDHDLCYYLLERNPLGDDNVYAKIVRDFDNCRSYLQIDFFDDNLVFNPKKEIIVPLEDAIVNWTGQFLIDPYNDIVLVYLKSDGDYWFMRVGLDGTVKQKVCVSHAVMNTGIPHPLVIQTAPLEFACYGVIRTEHYSEFRCYTLDSLFQVTDTLTSRYWDPGGYDKMILDNTQTILLAERFSNTYPDPTNGVVVCRIDRESQEMLVRTKFNTDPLHVIYFNDVPGTIGCARPFGLALAHDGNIYMAYDTQYRTVWPEGWIAIVKMTPNLDIIWQRYFLEPDVCSHMGSALIALENGGVAAGVLESEIGVSTVSFIVVDDQGGVVSDLAAQARPFMFYPNPVTDALHLRYSPDVNPKQVDLYDLEGRRMLIQQSDLERIDMEGLAPGVYTLRVLMDDGTDYTSKVVKQ